MTPKILIPVALAFVATLAAAPIASAQPNPACPYTTNIWYQPCSWNAPIPGLTQGWSPVDGIPGQYGPNGYTPIQ